MLQVWIGIFHLLSCSVNRSSNNRYSILIYLRHPIKTVHCFNCSLISNAFHPLLGYCSHLFIHCNDTLLICSLSQVQICQSIIINLHRISQYFFIINCHCNFLQIQIFYSYCLVSCTFFSPVTAFLFLFLIVSSLVLLIHYFYCPLYY
jgi:hypothetical protein